MDDDDNLKRWREALRDLGFEGWETAEAVSLHGLSREQARDVLLGKAALREFDAAVLLRDTVDAGFGKRAYPARTRGLICDLRPGDLHCLLEVFEPWDILTVMLEDLAPERADDAEG